MANHSTLCIGDKDTLSWRYDLPGPDDPILNFIFLVDDKKVYKESEDSSKYFCTYMASVSEVKKRFDRLHFTIAEIDQVISEVLGISIELVDIALMSDEEFQEKNPSPWDMDETDESDDEEWDRTVEEWEQLVEEKYRMDQEMEKYDFGQYPILRYLRLILDQSKDEEFVQLHMDEILPSEDSPEKLDYVEIVSESVDRKIKIERKYLEIAKIHFTEYAFDLVYIELIIALENTVNTYLKGRYLEISGGEGKTLNIARMVKNLSLINLLKFIIVFYGKRKLDKALIDSMERTYGRRNNVMHNRASTFKREEVVESIETTEKVIEIIKNLP